MQEVEIKLTAEEANDILRVLGQLPTASNAWPLMQKIGQQVQAQVTPPATEEQANVQ